MVESADARRKLVGTGIVLVIMTALISGVATFVNSFAVQGTNSDAFIALRNAFVAVLLVPIVLMARLLAGPAPRTPLRPVDWIRLACIGLIGGAIPFILFFRGLQFAGAGATTGSLVFRDLFLFATIFAVVFLRERMNVWMAVGAALLMAGNALLLPLTSPSWTAGVGLILAATVLWAGEYTLSKRMLRDLPSGTVALGRMGFGAIFLLAFLALSDQFGAVFEFTGPQLQWVALSGVLLLGFVMTWYTGLKHAALSVASVVLVLGFPITWALGVLAGRTAFTPSQAAGVLTIVFGVALGIAAATLREEWYAPIRIALARLRSPGRR